MCRRAAISTPPVIYEQSKNFPSFQILSACWAIGSIRMRSAANGASVSVKHRAVNESSLLKNILYLQDSVTWKDIFLALINQQSHLRTVPGKNESVTYFVCYCETSPGTLVYGAKLTTNYVHLSKELQFPRSVESLKGSKEGYAQETTDGRGSLTDVAHSL